MFFILGVTLFTSRVILDKLGVTDYGIYNVVYGFAMMFSFFQSSLSNAEQRFLKVSLAEEDVIKTNMIFNQSITIYIVMFLFIFLIAETLGIWFVFNKLVIPDNRLNAALMIFQFSIITVSALLFSTAYDAVLIAREDMKVYSYIGVLEALLKLLTAYVISFSSYDRLVFYGALLSIIAITKLLIYYLYCKKYPETNFHFYKNQYLFKKLFSFIGWNSYGSIANVLCSSGLNIVINFFFGPAVNAARAISAQLSNAVANFSTNIYTATTPQVIQSYAIKDMHKYIELTVLSSIIGFFLSCLMVFPGIFYSQYILSIWLKVVPEYSDLFTMWTLMINLIAILEQPILIATLATGELKKYYLLVSTVQLLSLPVIFFFFSIGFDAVWAFVFLFLFKLLSLLCGVFRLNELYNSFIRVWFLRVAGPVFLSSLLLYLMDTIVRFFLSDNLLSLICFSLISGMFSILLISIICLNKQERSFVMNFVRERYRK